MVQTKYKLAETLDSVTVAVVGLGYVGLPLALAFGRTQLPTYGFDINKKRVEDLWQGMDTTNEITSQEIGSSELIFTSEECDIKKSNFIIVAVPTPVTSDNLPDLKILEAASRLVGRNMTKGAIVVFESTVYPGVTEEVCLPLLEQESGLVCGQDFFIGYSPERINPGDKEHTLERIVKVVAGMDTATTKKVAAVYGAVCTAGVFTATSIKVAEAAKVIENTQRDLNIALINELSLIFHRLNINTNEVLEAAGTKWNFLKFTPGLVGGHCIGVDPYYLVYKARQVGYEPQIIAAGRKVNDGMSQFIATQMLEGLAEAGKKIGDATILVMGLTFKENVKDIRNSKIFDTIRFLQAKGAVVIGYDPLLTKEEIEEELTLPVATDLTGSYNGVILATPHQLFLNSLPELEKLSKQGKLVLVDVKGIFPSAAQNDCFIYKVL